MSVELALVCLGCCPGIYAVVDFGLNERLHGLVAFWMAAVSCMYV
jgi:hypothetical protein